MAAKFERVVPRFVVAALQGPGGDKWRTGVASVCSSMKKVIAGKCSELPAPSLDMRPWSDLWLVFHAAWGDFCKLLLRTAAKEQQRALEVLV